MEENKSILDEDEEVEEIVKNMGMDIENLDEVVIQTTEKKKSKFKIIIESIASFLFAVISCIAMCIACAFLAVLSILAIPFFAIYEIFARDFFDTMETKKVKKEDII